MSHWVKHPTGYESIRGTQCEIVLTKRPAYCDRGHYLAQVFAEGTLARDLDAQDGWPRYYFSRDVARSEVEAWLRWRGQWAAEPPEAKDAG